MDRRRLTVQYIKYLEWTYNITRTADPTNRVCPSETLVRELKASEAMRADISGVLDKVQRMYFRSLFKALDNNPDEETVKHHASDCEPSPAVERIRGAAVCVLFDVIWNRSRKYVHDDEVLPEFRSRRFADATMAKKGYFPGSAGYSDADTLLGAAASQFLAERKQQTLSDIMTQLACAMRFETICTYPAIVAREYVAGLRVRAVSSDRLGVSLQVREHL